MKRSSALALLSGASLALLALVVLSVAVLQSQHRARDDAIARFADRGKLAAQLLAGVNERSNTRQSADAQLRLSGRATPATLEAWEGESDPAIPYTALFDDRGRLLTAYPPTADPATSASGHAALRAATRGQPATSGVTSSSKGPVIETFVPFPAAGHGLRVLLVALPAELFAQLAAGALRGAAGTPNGNVYLTDRAGTLVTAIGKTAQRDDAVAMVSEAVRMERRNGRLGDERLVVRRVPNTGLVVALTAPEDELTADLPSVLAPRLALGGFALALLAVLLLSVRAVRDARRLEAARKTAEEATRVAHEANVAKSDFMSRMSHELRTPLNAILGFGQLLKMEQLSEHQQGHVDQIVKGGHWLLELINEILDISRIETGTLRLSLEPIPIGDVVQDALDLIRPLANERGIHLGAELPTETSQAHVVADRQRLGQVLLNLLSNAVKYNVPEGRVSVAVLRPDTARVRIGVTDTGPGIPEDRIPLLFTAFERLGAERTETEGIGLGLTLSKSLIEAMGGSLGVDTERGRGTTFWVELQVADATTQSKTAAGSPR